MGNFFDVIVVVDLFSFVSSGEFVKGLRVLWDFVGKLWNDIVYVVVIYVICVKIEFNFVLCFIVDEKIGVIRCIGGKINI